MPTEDERPSVVEVGSGTGVAGLGAAVAGASRVVLTDLPGCVPKLWASIRRNDAILSGADVTAAALTWGDAAAVDEIVRDGSHGFDLVLAADVLYSNDPSVHAALRATLVALARPRDALIWHCYEVCSELTPEGRPGLQPPPPLRPRTLPRPTMTTMP